VILQSAIRVYLKIVRSTKCSLKFTTDQKRIQLRGVLSEYGHVVNIFIEHFWNTGEIYKAKLLKPIIDIPDTWLSARLRKVAAREALDMISSTKRRWKDSPDKMRVPVHKGKRMSVSCTIVDLQEPKKTNEFDSWLHLSSIGNKTIMDLPIRFHKHYNRLYSKGERLNSYIITEGCVQFYFEIETGEKKGVRSIVGVDTGIKTLASLSNGQQLGKDIEGLIARVKRCEYGSKGHQRARNTLKQRIDEVSKEVVGKADMVVVEKLKNLGKNSKLKRRLSKNIRRSIGIWNWKYWLMRLEQRCEWNRVSFRSVSPYQTSTTCSECGHIDRRNRSGEVFRCLNCGHRDNADVNAARNILERFLTGKYGTCYKL